MKKSKFNILTIIGIFIMSTLLFTISCEKEDGTLTKKSKFAKFKALHFTGEVASTSTNSSAGSGTFTGNSNGDITFIPPHGETPTFTPTGGENQIFTNPTSTDKTFIVNSNFNFLHGGGVVTLGSKSYDMTFGLCLSSDIFGMTDAPDADNLKTYIGISGNFDIDNINYDGEYDNDNSINLLLYVFSYNNRTQIGTFDDFKGGKSLNGAYIIAVEFKDAGEPDLYFAVGGNVNFVGDNINMNGIQMRKISIDEDFLEGNIINLSATLECGTLGNFFED